MGIHSGRGRGRTQRLHHHNDTPIWHTNGIISFCNASGAYNIASHGGLLVKHLFQSEENYARYLSLAFGVLAVIEYQGYRDAVGANNLPPPLYQQGDPCDDDSSNRAGRDLASSSSYRRKVVSRFSSSVWNMAIPMTLNNLAGGVGRRFRGAYPRALGHVCFLDILWYHVVGV
jgi:hypothetical protein